MRSLLPFLLVACHREPEPAELTADGASSPLVPSVLTVSIAGPSGAASVEYGLDGFDSATPQTAPGASHRVPVLGLKAGRSYQWRAVVVDADGVRHESAPATFDVPDAPADLQGGSVVVHEDDAELGYFFATIIFNGRTSYAAVVDRDGDFVWWVDSVGHVATTPELGIDRTSLVWSQYTFDKVDDEGLLVRVSLDGQTRTETRLALGHHDFVQHDDGTIAFLALERHPTYPMVSDVIEVGAEGLVDGDPTERVFSMFDDFPLDPPASPGDPAATCSHITSLDQEVGQPDPVAEWTHGNSLMYLPETDAYYLNDKFTDWLMAIDRQTGALRWVMNGRVEGITSVPTFTAPGGDPLWVDAETGALWSHGHMSDLWDGGGLMFDNGDHHGVTRAMEFRWDEAAGTAEAVWTFDEPNGHLTAALGDVRRMPGGHRLIAWSGEPGNGYIGPVTEVDPDTDTIRWRFEPPPDGQIGRLVPFTDLYTLE